MPAFQPFKMNPNGMVKQKPVHPLGPSPRGRPVSNTWNYMIRPTSEGLTGFEMLNDTPSVLEQVNQKYLKAGQLPPALQPKYLRRPEALDVARKRNISSGFAKNPRSKHT